MGVFTSAELLLLRRGVSPKALPGHHLHFLLLILVSNLHWAPPSLWLSFCQCSSLYPICFCWCPPTSVLLGLWSLTSITAYFALWHFCQRFQAAVGRGRGDLFLTCGSSGGVILWVLERKGWREHPVYLCARDCPLQIEAVENLAAKIVFSKHVLINSFLFCLQEPAIALPVS